jgi:hypothetical protein
MALANTLTNINNSLNLDGKVTRLRLQYVSQAPPLEVTIAGRRFSDTAVAISRVRQNGAHHDFTQ